VPRIVIVGDRESGKTTLLGLLYAAQVKSGSARSDAFRFHVAHESLEEISEAFEQIMSGTFPDSATKEGIHGITFHVGYRKPGLGILMRRRSRGWTSGASATLRFLLLRNFEEEMARFRKGSSFANAALRDVLESDGVAILVDSTKLASREEDRGSTAMARYDLAVDSLLAALQRSRLHGGRKELHPLFIFSKFDSVDPGALRAAGVEGPPPEVGKTGSRRSFAEALLDPALPRTMQRVRDPVPEGPTFARPSFFFSSVRTEPASAGRSATIRLRAAAGGGWEPDYSVDEYLAMLERFWEIASNAET
jgi:hypothetical protein